MDKHHSQLPISEPQDTERYRTGRRITWVSVIVNIVLTAMQVVVGVLAHSQALVADAMHTLSDVIADFFVLYANRKGNQAADAEHPYGHGRFETAASLVLGLLLVATGVGILVTAVERLQNVGSLPPVGVAAIWAAVLTLAGKEGLFRYMLAVAERLRSPMLIANAWHARADALSSLVVAAGVGGALLGFPVADAVAAIVVGGMIVKAGAGFAWEAISELIDTGVAEEEVASIRSTIEETPGVIGLHDLRTRRMAQKILIDAHVQVDGHISVSEGHRIGDEVRRRVLAAHEDVVDMLVHIDPEDDMRGTGSNKLPDRQVLLAHLGALLGGETLPKPYRVQLHYLGGRVEAEVFVSRIGPSEQERLEGVERVLAERLATDPYFRSISIHWGLAPKQCS
jgi:cation diffusion facilitator family transporter